MFIGNYKFFNIVSVILSKLVKLFVFWILLSWVIINFKVKNKLILIYKVNVENIYWKIVMWIFL